MLEFYPQIKALHVACVVLTGMLFTCRGLLMLAESEYTNHIVLRWTSYVIDTTLLIAGLLLMQITSQYPVTHDWLSVKLGLLIVYIVLGIYALRRGHSLRSRTGFFVAALAVYLFMFSIARGHHPLGLFVTHSVF